MKRTALFTFAIVLSILFFASPAKAQSTGTGSTGTPQVNWVDANGDGICDNVGTANQGNLKAGRGFGKKDGTGTAARPQDGTGLGNKSGNLTTTGTCAGNGSKGNSARRGGK